MARRNLPILLVTFNRPAQTESVLRTLSIYEPSTLYISNDGPRNSNNSDTLLTSQIRAWSDPDVNFFQSPNTVVKTLFHPLNKGCRIAYNQAMKWFFNSEAYGIVLEDDTLPELSFFQYASELLERFENDTRIGSISAYTHFRISSQYSYRFSVIPHVWGFATWRRVHDLYHEDLSLLSDSRMVEIISNAVPKSQVSRWLALFRSTASGVTDTWCHGWVLSHFANNLLSVVPNNQLVTNIGFGPSSTHTDVCIQDYYPGEPLLFPLVHPSCIQPSKSTDLNTFSAVFKRKIASEAMSSIARRLGTLKNTMVSWFSFSDCRSDDSTY